MTASTKEGKEIFSQSKIYMPVPQKMGRGGKMGRGPYEKSGIIEDTGLPVNRMVQERFDILVPVPDGESAEADREIDVAVKLWYLPYGTRNADPFLWREFTKKVLIGEGH